MIDVDAIPLEKEKPVVIDCDTCNRELHLCRCCCETLEHIHSREQGE